MKVFFLLAILTFFINFTNSKKRGKKKRSKFPENSVQQKGILRNYNETHIDSSFKAYSGKVLGFVTPWNSEGYKIAENYHHKFDYISPVWYEVKVKESRFEIEDNDEPSNKFKWLNRMKKTNVKIVPRVKLGLESREHYHAFFSNEGTPSYIARIVTHFEFDGIVFEYGFVKYNIGMLPWFKKLREVLKNQTIILVVPPIRHGEPDYMTTSDFSEIKHYVDFVVVMAYDYQGKSLAPVHWVKRSIENVASHRKVLMGLQFYGYKFYEGKEPKPILYKEYLKLLKRVKPEMKWDSAAKEHYFSVKGRYEVRYPTLKFLEERLVLSKKICGGIAIWEIGQGCKYFLDLL